MKKFKLMLQKAYYGCVLIVLLAIPLNIAGQQNSYRNELSLGTGFTTNTLFDDYLNHQHYQGTDWLPLFLGFSKYTEETWQRIRFYINKTRLNPINEIAYYEYNYVESIYGLLTYEYLKKVINKPTISFLVGGGLSGHGSDRMLHVYNNLNPSVDLLDSTLNSYHMVTPSVDVLLGVCFSFIPNLEITATGGIPLVSLFSRPYTFNRRLSNGGISWKLLTINKHKGFHYDVGLKYAVHSRFNVGFNHSFLFCKYKNHYEMKNAISISQVQLGYRFGTR